MKKRRVIILLALVLILIGIIYYDSGNGPTKWRFITAMNEPRALDVSLTMPDGEILFGDYYDDSKIDVRLQEFNPKTEKWTSFIDKRVLSQAGRPSSLLPKGRGERLDCAHLWSNLPKTDHLGDQLPVGNDASGFSAPIILPTGELFHFDSCYFRSDGANGKIKLFTHPRYGLLLNILVLKDNRILLVSYAETSATLDEVIYDSAADTWEAVKDPAPAVGQTMTLLPDGKVLAIGGAVLGPALKYLWNSFNPWATMEPLSMEYRLTGTCRLFDPKTNTWRFTDALHIPRAFHTTNLLQDGRVLVTGGYTELVDAAVKPNALTNTCEIINLKDVDP